jgi:hypothetical protein
MAADQLHGPVVEVTHDNPGPYDALHGRSTNFPPGNTSAMVVHPATRAD